jgi:hypothetical protein
MFIGWDFDSEVAVTLELWDPVANQYEILYQGTLTIMPLGP